MLCMTFAEIQLYASEHGAGVVLYGQEVFVADAVLHGQQQYGHTENSAKHGGGSMRLLMRPDERRTEWRRRANPCGALL